MRRTLAAWLFPFVLTSMAFAGVRDDYSLTVSGDVPKTLKLSLSELRKLPHLTVKFRDKDGTENSYEGVEVMEVLKDAGLVVAPHPGKAMAAYVSTVATDGYQVVFGLGELIRGISGRTVVLAYSENGKPLGDNVGPLRLIVSDDKVQARCIRMVTELKFVELRK